MSNRIFLACWTISVIAMSIAGSSIWQRIELAEEVGSSELELSGFIALPLIGALLLLQVASILVSALLPILATRVVSGLLALVSLVSASILVINLNDALTAASELLVAQTIGVAGDLGQLQYIQDSTVSFWPSMFVAFLFGNGAVLVLQALFLKPNKKSRVSKASDMAETDLWGSQKS